MNQVSHKDDGPSLPRRDHYPIGSGWENSKYLIRIPLSGILIKFFLCVLCALAVK